MREQNTKHYLIFDRLHMFKVKQLVETNEISPKLYFLFDEDKQFKKARIE